VAKLPLVAFFSCTWDMATLLGSSWLMGTEMWSKPLLEVPTMLAEVSTCSLITLPPEFRNRAEKSPIGCPFGLR